MVFYFAVRPIRNGEKKDVESKQVGNFMWWLDLGIAVVGADRREQCRTQRRLRFYIHRTNDRRREQFDALRVDWKVYGGRSGEPGFRLTCHKRPPGPRK